MQLNYLRHNGTFSSESKLQVQTSLSYPLVKFVIGMLVELCIYLTSCGGGAATKTPPLSVAPTITTQPASQTMLLGRSATFTVAASGTAPLLYQWYKNGAAISNANAATYTTPVVTAADNNSTYSVTISNSAGSVTSTVATLFTGPRAPAIGDLRYLQWEQVPLFSEIGNQYGAGFLHAIDGYSITTSGMVPYPLSIGSNAAISGDSYNFVSCAWTAQNTGIAPGIPVLPLMDIFTFGTINPALGQNYTQYLQSMATPKGVITSMDYHPACQQIGILQLSTSQSTEPDFDQRMELVDPANLQTQVAADGAASRIVSAVTYDRISGKFVLLSYGWQGDTTTAYEAATFIAQPANVLADAEQLANQGYFISAVGGDDTGGYAIIGMRVAGDTMPRPWHADYTPTGSFNTQILSNGNLPTVPDPAPSSPILFIVEAPANNLSGALYSFDEQ
uniref:Ig-like domain-containing protein n=1 Tax=mine drainage metagenome TaxID=410659 RepID=E6PYJ4_9ZZZZ